MNVGAAPGSVREAAGEPGQWAWPGNGTVQASLGKHVPWVQVRVPEEMTLKTLFSLLR